MSPDAEHAKLLRKAVDRLVAFAKKYSVAGNSYHVLTDNEKNTFLQLDGRVQSSCLIIRIDIPPPTYRNSDSNRQTLGFTAIPYAERIGPPKSAIRSSAEWFNRMVSLRAMADGLVNFGTQKKLRGRKKEYDQVEDNRLSTDWQAARAQGSTKSRFCRDRGIKVKDLERTLSRVRTRRLRAQ